MPAWKRPKAKRQCGGCQTVQPRERLIEDDWGACNGCNMMMKFERVEGGYRPKDHPPKNPGRAIALPGQRRMYRRGGRSL